MAVRTAFRGPGARDCFEAVTRAVTDDRYVVDRSLLRADRGRLLEDFVFEVSIDGRSATLLLREGFVTDEFIDLARMPSRTPDQDHRFAAVKADLAHRVMAIAGRATCSRSASGAVELSHATFFLICCAGARRR